MRIWSLHPKYLDSKGLVALWREALLAKNVLEGKTKGYKNHPQLLHFKETKSPIGAINKYLEEIFNEAIARNYKFDRKKIGKTRSTEKIKVSRGQIKYEFAHLLNKLKKRDKLKFEKIRSIAKVKPHPLFLVQKGSIEQWEKI